MRIAAALSSVIPFVSSISSSGFLTTSEKHGCKMFYSFVQNEKEDAPILVWLQGGPGISSLVGNFFEVGPSSLNADGTLSPMETAWSTKFHMLFLDAPEGVGFSYCSNESGLPKLSEEVSSRLHKGLIEFFSLHQELTASGLYLTGEDYAGHMIPPLASLLVHSPIPKVALTGIAIGNGHTHPVTQVLTRAQSAKYFGLVDDGPCYVEALGYSTAASFLAEIGKYEASFEQRTNLEECVSRCSFGVNLKDVRTTKSYASELYARLDAHVNSESVRKELLGEASEQFNGVLFKSYNPEVIQRMKGDVMRSVANHLIPVLDSGVKVLLYQGLFDWIDGVFSNEQWISGLHWKWQKNYDIAGRKPWKSQEGELLGFIREFGNLRQVSVRNAGHMVSLNQPESAFEMITDFVFAFDNESMIEVESRDGKVGTAEEKKDEENEKENNENSKKV